MKIICVLLFVLPIFATDQLLFERGEGKKLICYFDKPENSAFSIVLIIPGSQKESSKRMHDSLQKDLVATGRSVLTLEKQGINGEEIDEKEFHCFLSIDERVGDHLHLLKSLKPLIPNWNGQISILGQGDGGRIGASLAAKVENVEALILVAAGGAWPALEEALYSFRSEMVDSGYPPQYIHGFLVGAKQEFAAALEMPKTHLKAFGYTYKYWESLLKSNLFNDLIALKCPIYSVNGVNDNRVPIESVDSLGKSLKDKITLKRKEKAGREIIQDHKTYVEAISWLDHLSP